MRPNPFRPVLLGAMLFTCSTASAIDPESAKAYCDEVRQAAKNAQQKAIQVSAPRQDPSRTFNGATQKCMEWVAQQSIPSVPMFQSYPAVQKMFEQFAIRMLNKQCQEAGQQFDKSVNDALRSVNEQYNDYGQIIGYAQGAGATMQGARSNVMLTPTTQVPQQQQQAEPSTWDRIVNFLGGD